MFSFSTRTILFCPDVLSVKRGLKVLQKFLSFPTSFGSSWEKNFLFAALFNLTTKFLCCLYLRKSSSVQVCLDLFFNLVRTIIALLSSFDKWGLLFPLKIAVLKGACLSSFALTISSNSSYVLGLVV